MTNAFHLPAGAGGLGTHHDEGETMIWWQRLPLMALLFAIVTIGVVMALNIPGATDYIGADNDDGMRLVEVRDLLAGQGWFDLMQYRLGLDGGTLMHWSRLIDAPIAGLILFFGLFTDPRGAEALAATVWPMLLIFPLIFCVGLGARRLGGVGAMNIAMALAAILLTFSNKFLPGSIDHHNVQLILIAGLATVLLDGRYGVVNFAVGGALAAVAIAIGAETTPLVAAACLAVTGLWVVNGRAFRAAAMSFGLSLSISVSVLFFALVPPSRYAAVTCDSLSLGFYALATLGGLGMALSARHLSGLSLQRRALAAAGNGVLVLVAAAVIAPQCLGSPLADLDPLLVTMWLNGIGEAQSILAEMRNSPATIGGFYATGFFAIAVCAMRVLRDDRREAHAVILVMLLMAWVISLLQLRGTIFASLLAILPLSLLIAELRRRANAEPENMAAGFLFFAVTLASVPSAWIVAGVLPSQGAAGLMNHLRAAPASVAPVAAAGKSCESEEALVRLAGLPAGVVVASNSMGVPILRFTGHRVLTAPYHRNQAGMLTELHIGMAGQTDAAAFLRGAKADYLAFCDTDPSVADIVKASPQGLYADLLAGRVPAYLQPLPQDAASGLRLFSFAGRPQG